MIDHLKLLSTLKSSAGFMIDHKWEKYEIIFAGVYGMWNIYVFCLMVLYAPSYKTVSALAEGTDGKYM